MFCVLLLSTVWYNTWVIVIVDIIEVGDSWKLVIGSLLLIRFSC